MRSMTGYGKAEIDRDRRTMSIEMKAVNHRFLDLNVKLPKVLNFCEDKIRKLIQNSLSRGHVDVYVTYRDSRRESAGLKLDENAAYAYYEDAKQFCEKHGIPFALGAADILRLPEVLIENVCADDEEVLWALTRDTLSGALQQLNAMREKEGEALKKDFCQKLSVLSELVAEAEKRAPLVAEEYREKLKARLSEALEQVELDEAKLINEVAFFVDRACIDEEIARLKAHLSHFNDILAQCGPVGRKLDFLIQEMNRETNTIGSKSNDSALTEKVLLMKSEIEKLREQIQNIE